MRDSLRLIPPMLFLACSWTWVIGMFFPLYLTTELGWHAWLVFAIPNVIGAASVGVVLKSPDRARTFIERHKTAALWFSAWTALFQMVIAAWLIRHVLGSLPPDGLPFGLVQQPIVTGLTLLFAVLTLLSALMPLRTAMKVSVGVFLTSAVCIAVAVAFPDRVPALSLPVIPPDADQMQLLLITPAIVFGFLLCPYLDLTINAVRRSMDDPEGSIAFIAGFAGPFLILVALTAGYAGHWQQTGTLPVAVLLHIVVQASFTAGIHLRALVAAGAFRRFDRQLVRQRVATVRLALFTMCAALAIPFGGVLSDMSTPVEGTPTARVVYDALIAPYGFVIPAYLYIVAVPLPMLRGWSTQRKRMLFLVSVLAAAPFMTISLLSRDNWGYAAGVSVIVVLPFVLSGLLKPRTTTENNAS